MFRDDPTHPGLHFKKVYSDREIFSARVNLAYRALAIRDGDDLIWFWVGDHDEYDRLITR